MTDLREKLTEIVWSGTGGNDVDRAAKIADAIIAALPGMVPPLVWSFVASTGERNVHEAYEFCGRYVAWPDGAWRLHGHRVGGIGEGGTLDAAKAAAQADYEARILSALEKED